jgi:hypothetical protein
LQRTQNRQHLRSESEVLSKSVITRDDLAQAISQHIVVRFSSNKAFLVGIGPNYNALNACSPNLKLALMASKSTSIPLS